MRANTIKRIVDAETALKVNDKQTMYRCFFSDGRVEKHTVLEALCMGRGVDDDMLLFEPYMYKCELIGGRDLLPKLCDVFEQMVASNAEKAQQGMIHRTEE